MKSLKRHALVSRHVVGMASVSSRDVFVIEVSILLTLISYER